jgi:hypothetical protein
VKILYKNKCLGYRTIKIGEWGGLTVGTRAEVYQLQRHVSRRKEIITINSQRLHQWTWIYRKEKKTINKINSDKFTSVQNII